MKRIKNSLIAFVGLSALIAIIAAVTPGTTQGQSGSTTSKDVNVINTPSVNVANSPGVRAQQAGPWSVSLDGTPSVNLVERASVGIDPNRNTVKLDESVGIDPNRNTVKLDESAREPVMIRFNVTEEVPNGGYLSNTYMIPEGKRLVVEHVYGSVNGTQSGLPPHVNLYFEGVHDGVPPFMLRLLCTPQPGLSSLSITQSVKFYVPNPVDDDNQWVIYLTSGSGMGVGVWLAGYLEPLP